MDHFNVKSATFPQVSIFILWTIVRAHSNLLYLIRKYYGWIQVKQESMRVLLVLGGRHDARRLPYGNFILNMARLLKAHIYVLEHRFYGRSKPNARRYTPTTSKYLPYLSVDQTLHDVRRFVEHIGHKEIILVGREYGGSLAIWFQHRFAGIVNGVWALNAPLAARFIVPTYYERLGQNIRRIGGRKCYDRIKESIRRTESQYRKQLQKGSKIYNTHCCGCDVRAMGYQVAKNFASAIESGR